MRFCPRDRVSVFDDAWYFCSKQTKSNRAAKWSHILCSGMVMNFCTSRYMAALANNADVAVWIQDQSSLPRKESRLVLRGNSLTHLRKNGRLR